MTSCFILFHRLPLQFSLTKLFTQLKFGKFRKPAADGSMPGDAVGGLALQPTDWQGRVIALRLAAAIAIG